MKKKNRKGMNKYQKAAFRPGEHKTRREDVDRYLVMAKSDDPDERLEAAENLCPCHVRRRIDDVWQALYRMMEDPVSSVRRAAWHTLEDGGVPNDPAIEAIFRRAVDGLEQESDRGTRSFIKEFAVPYLQEREQVDFQRTRLSTSPYQQLGKCDFCGRTKRMVRTNYDTELAGSNGVARLSLICQVCDEV
ncbi:MAG: hypothetical protein AAF702_23175 [Chloroflexota bacterium]